MSKSFNLLCSCCRGGYVYKARAKLLQSQGKPVTCLDCGDAEAKRVSARHTVAPINKSNYMYIHDPELLKQLNPKRTI